MPIERRLEGWLARLVCYGLFQKSNEECIKKMIAFTSSCQHPAQLLRQGIFPLMAEVLVNNMRANHEEAVRLMEGESSLL